MAYRYMRISHPLSAVNPLCLDPSITDVPMSHRQLRPRDVSLRMYSAEVAAAVAHQVSAM